MFYNIGSSSVNPATADIIASQSQDYVDEGLAEYQDQIMRLQGKSLCSKFFKSKAHCYKTFIWVIYDLVQFVIWHSLHFGVIYWRNLGFGVIYELVNLHCGVNWPL